jgi:hypothetical protein
LQTNLILKAIDTDERQKSLNALKFIADVGLIPDYREGVESFLAKKSASDEVPALRAERRPPSLVEREIRCGKVQAALDFLEKGDIERPSKEQMAAALRAGGIDPDGKSSSWGLPWGRFGATFGGVYQLKGYSHELGCVSQSDLFRLNEKVYETPWRVECSPSPPCGCRLDSDWDTFINMSLSYSGSRWLATISTGTDGVTPQAVVVDGKIFSSGKPEYAISGEEAIAAVRDMCPSRFVKNVPHDRTVKLDGFCEALREVEEREARCLGETITPID